jgi:hypothetical protein
MTLFASFMAHEPGETNHLLVRKSSDQKIPLRHRT